MRRLLIPLIFLALASMACNLPRGKQAPSVTAPAPAAPTSTPAALTEHTVVPGETLASIAQRYGIPVDTLASVNGIPNPDRIYSGQKLKLEAAAQKLAPRQVYLNVSVVKQTRSLSCESASACSLLRYTGYLCASDAYVLDALPRSPDNPHRGFVGPADSPAGMLPVGAADAQVGGYGVYVEALHAGLAGLGVKSQYQYGTTLDTLRGLLDQGTPVLIIATHKMGGYGTQPVVFVPADGDGSPVTVIRYEHSYVVNGYDADGFWAIDPWSGDVEYFTVAHLDSDWGRLGRQALWVTR
ncbi:MAG: LysM peptidoglycan-binding domain-containing protein [Anaerolineae bacterium]|nr:LysM peptidoglycan-binding domain-containing protein [Anaerolineae bacterium]